jgi:hypothetical protein
MALALSAGAMHGSAAMAPAAGGNVRSVAGDHHQQWHLPSSSYDVNQV